VNHTRFPKEDRLPDCANRDNQVKKGDRVETVTFPMTVLHEVCYFLRYVSCGFKILHRCWDNCDLLPYCNIYWFTATSREWS